MKKKRTKKTLEEIVKLIEDDIEEFLPKMKALAVSNSYNPLQRAECRGWQCCYEQLQRLIEEGDTIGKS